MFIKPQFEAGREQVGKGGVVRDPAVHREVLAKLVEFARSLGLHTYGLIVSPLRGPAGNVEFFAHWAWGQGERLFDLETAVQKCIAEAALIRHRPPKGRESV